MTAVAQPNIHKSVLMTPDPYHVPGYGGFCAQFKYQIGETFGRTTSRLLGDDCVASSGRLVLSNNHPVKGESQEIQEGRMDLIRTRKQSWGDQKLVEKMVPGYTGFVPKTQHYFGKRYAENCVNAISDFENDQRGHNQRVAELRLTEALQSGRLEKKQNDIALPDITNRYTTPLEPIAKEPRPFISKSTPHHTMSPYYMGNKNPDKRFMSGYTGFVPRARGLLGAGYPHITHKALNEFSETSRRAKAQSAEPIRIQREMSAPCNTKPIYPTESGLVPHYTGHIPGEQFKCGETFGDSTNPSCPNQSPASESARPARALKRKCGFPELGRRRSPDTQGTRSPTSVRRTPPSAWPSPPAEANTSSKRTRASAKPIRV